MVGVWATHMDKVTDGTTDGITDGVGTIRMAGTTAGDMAMIPTDMDMDMDTTLTAGTTVGAGTMVGTTTLGLRQAEIAPEQGQPAQQRPVLLLEPTTATVGRQNTPLFGALE